MIRVFTFILALFASLGLMATPFIVAYVIGALATIVVHWMML